MTGLREWGLSLGVLGMLSANCAVAQSSSYVAPRIGAQYGKVLETLPDWNGTWDMTDAAGKDSNVPETAIFDPAHAYVPKRSSNDIGFDVGLLPGTYLTGIPYRSEYEKKYKEVIRKDIQGLSEDAVGACQPYGMPRIMFGTPFGPQIFMTPGVVVMSLSKGETRFIYTDGRPHPAGLGLAPSWEGHSIGHWEGDALVIDTVSVFPGTYDQTGAPHSDRIHIIERIRRTDRNTLEDRMTIEDPVMFTRAWNVIRTYARAPERRPDIFDFVCPPNNGVDMSNGYQRVILPSERGKSQTEPQGGPTQSRDGPR